MSIINKEKTNNRISKDSPCLYLLIVEAVDPDAYILTITRVAGGQKWNILVAVAD